MTREAYFRRALAAPLVAPLLAVPLALAFPPLLPWALLLAGSVVFGGVPYLVFAVLMTVWARHRSLAALQRGALAAPLLFAPFCGIGLTLFYALAGDAVPTFADVRAHLGYGAWLALLFGYAYVAAVFAGDWLRRQRRYAPDEVAAARRRDAAR